jgi:hypothetical protein
MISKFKSPFSSFTRPRTNIHFGPLGEVTKFSIEIKDFELYIEYEESPARVCLPSNVEGYGIGGVFESVAYP